MVLCDRLRPKRQRAITTTAALNLFNDITIRRHGHYYSNILYLYKLLNLNKKFGSGCVESTSSLVFQFKLQNIFAL